MPIARRNTPPTSQIKEQVSVLKSLSAWTDEGADVDGKEEAKKRTDRTYNKLISEDDSGEAGNQKKCQKICAVLTDVESDNFQLVIGIVIMLNAIVIGLETSEHDGNGDKSPNVMWIVIENMLQATFFLEMILRLKHDGKDYFKSAWNIFDFTLVFIGILDLWIFPLLALVVGTDHNSFLYHFSAARLLRILRLLRVLRVIRLFRMFNQLYLIMQAFNKAFQIVGLISILIFILDYVCAIVLTQAIGMPAKEKLTAGSTDQNLATLGEMFGTIPDSMQTLFLVMTLSNWNDVAVAIENGVPGSAKGLIYVAFVFYVMITTYTGTSLITGIISESLIHSQTEYKENKLRSFDKKKKEVANELNSFLAEMHEDEMDSFGCVDHEDLKTSMRGDTELLNKLAASGINLEEAGLLSLIDNLSHDGKDRINLQYFADKLTNLVGNASASSVCDMKYEMVRIHQKLDALARKMYPNEDIFQPPTKVEEPQSRPSYTAQPMPAGRRSSLRNQQVKAPGSGKKVNMTETVVEETEAQG